MFVDRSADLLQVFRRRTRFSHLRRAAMAILCSSSDCFEVVLLGLASVCDESRPAAAGVSRSSSAASDVRLGSDADRFRLGRQVVRHVLADFRAGIAGKAFLSPNGSLNGSGVGFRGCGIRNGRGEPTGAVYWVAVTASSVSADSGRWEATSAGRRSCPCCSAPRQPPMSPTSEASRRRGGRLARGHQSGQQARDCQQSSNDSDRRKPLRTTLPSGRVVTNCRRRRTPCCSLALPA